MRDNRRIHGDRHGVCSSTEGSVVRSIAEATLQGQKHRYDAITLLLTEYFHYYHHWRTHRALDMDCPVPRPVQRPEVGSIREVPEVGGLHHHYERRAA